MLWGATRDDKPPIWRQLVLEGLRVAERRYKGHHPSHGIQNSG